MATKIGRAEVQREIQQMLGTMPSWVSEMPEGALVGFWTTMRDLQLAETHIPNKYKELIGLAVSGATRCRYCTLFHTEAARLAGATDAEIAEASAMGGFTMMASTFLNAQQTDYEQFRKETLQIVAHLKSQAPAPRPQDRSARA
ncbi:MAG: carboxymuconolactone decarboxylase family protein [Myxococcota bacterium]|nr:carboxymuconolactone decarboxylase family protein [Myxococcota bacterium]